MSFCNHCGNENKDDSALFCANCGSSLKEQIVEVIPVEIKEEKSNYCYYCGKEVKDGSVFCSRCGVPLNEAKKENSSHFCYYCGNEIEKDAVFCSSCGESLKIEGKEVNQRKRKSYGALKAFMIIGCIFNAFYYLIPLFWCLPMTINLFEKIRSYEQGKSGEKVSTAFKICTLLFVNTIAGIILLCDKDL